MPLMNVYEFSNYRAYLRGVWAERTKNNPNYSLRAMARDCGLASSTLSEAINGKKNLSYVMAKKIAAALKLKSKESTFFCDLVQLELSKDPEMKEEIIKKLKRSHPQHLSVFDLDVEQFKQISEWYHSAILELSLMKNFDFTISNISKILKVSKPAVVLALTRLEKLGLLKRTEAGSYVRSNVGTVIRSETKSAAFRQYYREMFEKASHALETQTPLERLSGFLNISLNPKTLPQIDEALTRFFNEIKEITADCGDETEVYHCMVHFFNLTENKTKLTGDENV